MRWVHRYANMHSPLGEASLLALGGSCLGIGTDIGTTCCSIDPARSINVWGQADQ